MKRALITLVVSILFVSTIVSQEKEADNIQRTFYYSFTNVSSIEQVEDLQEDIEALKSVVKVKIEYKVEKAAGQVVVIVIEETRTSEGQVFFNIQDLKKLIIENGLIPNELKQEEIILQK